MNGLITPLKKLGSFSNWTKHRRFRSAGPLSLSLTSEKRKQLLLERGWKKKKWIFFQLYVYLCLYNRIIIYFQENEKWREIPRKKPPQKQMTFYEQWHKICQHPVLYILCLLSSLSLSTLPRSFSLLSLYLFFSYRFTVRWFVLANI